MKKLILCLLAIFLMGSFFGCNQTPVDKPEEKEKEQENNNNENNEQEITYLTVSEALDLAISAGESGTSEMCYVKGTVKNITNATYGEMYITDGEKELYVYGVYSSDGANRYVDLENNPYSCDEVFLYGTLKTYKGKPELGASWLQKFISHQGEVDLSSFANKTIKEAREAEVGSKVIIEGVVGVITYANGMKPNGIYVIDETGSIYVYGLELAGRVKVGEKVKLAGTKTLYILDSEQDNAAIYGYQGSIQLQDPIFISSDGGNHEFDKSAITSATIKKMLETPMSENITTNIYKVNAIIKKVPGSGFVNYYIDDLDGVTGSYCYSLCNGSDYSYLDQYDGKICTVYLSALNCKATKSGTVYRFVPVLVEENNSFTMTDKEIGDFALEYYIKGQFKNEYNNDPELELITKVSNEYIPFEDVLIQYQANDDIVSFNNENDKYLMHIRPLDKDIVITISATYHDVKASSEVSFKVVNKEIPDTISIKDAIEAIDGSTVTVRGIVMSGTINQTGFYLNDGTGVIAVRTNSTTIKNLTIGNDVVITGTKTHVVKSGSTQIGQICIDDATLVVNLLGNHEIDTASFITDKTFDEIYDMAASDGDYTAQAYVVKCYLKKVESPYSTNFYLTDATKTKDIYLYAGSGSQYSIYNEFVGDIELTVALMFVNWNSKIPYRACIIYASDGEKLVVNNYNFR